VQIYFQLFIFKIIQDLFGSIKYYTYLCPVEINNGQTLTRCGEVYSNLPYIVILNKTKKAT